MRSQRVRVDGASLAISYSPAGSTAIVALHGASAGTRSHPLYRHLHDVLPPMGIGVATFDRRGEGASSGEASVGRFELQARDALAVAAALDVERIGLWGFSQGGWVAPLAASISSRVGFLVLVASTGVSPASQMVYAAEQQIRRAGFGPEAVRRALALRRGVEAWIRRPEPAAGVRLLTELRGARGEPWWDLAFLPAELPGPEDRAAWLAEMDFDPIPVFAAVRVPTIAFYGADDAWTPVKPSVEAWRRAQGGAAEVVVIPGASHELTLADGRLAPRYEERLVAWLEALARPRRGGPAP